MGGLPRAEQGLPWRSGLPGGLSHAPALSQDRDLLGKRSYKEAPDSR